MHEGARSVLTREDGSTDTMEPKRIEAKAEMRANYKEVEKIEPADVTHMLDSLAEGLAREKFRTFLQSIDDAVTKVGNVTTPGKSGVETFFEGLEKRLLDFNDDGSPATTQFLVGSDEAAERLKGIMREIESTPELRRRYEAIMEKKRGEWHDREAARNLAEQGE